MAKAATKKSPKTPKVSKLKKAAAVKSSRATPAKPVKTIKAPIAKKAIKAGIPAKKTRAARAPVISKDELRTQIEKLTAANGALKTKGRETAKALKAAERQIEVLEHQISQIEAKAVIQEKPTEKVKVPRKTRTLKTSNHPSSESENGQETEDPADLETL